MCIYCMWGPLDSEDLQFVIYIYMYMYIYIHVYIYIYILYDIILYTVNESSTNNMELGVANANCSYFMGPTP